MIGKVFGLLSRIIKDPKTTMAGILGGGAAGLAVMAAGTYVATQAQCNFANVDWVQVAEILFVSGAAGGTVGGVMKDGKKEDTKSV